MDLTGKVFGRWTVTGVAERRGKYRYFHVKCECGTTREVRNHSLTRGISKSCGCLMKEILQDRGTHHMSNSVEYSVFRTMWNRCKLNDGGKYAERMPPIEWKDFSEFYKELGQRPGPNFTLERLDNNKPYGPGNCAWVPSKVNARNKSNNVFVTYKDQTKTIAEWAEELGLLYSTLRWRINNWPLEKALKGKA